MARNKKVEILSNDKEVLHPMTDGDCVIFEDGQTLTQKLSEDDSVKYTPEIVNSSPMFKVGEGNTVDYSDNVLDGAYERVTLQGQTYVNYIQESSADEVTLPTPFTEYERTQHNTLTSDEEGTLGINLVGQSYVNALQHDSEEEFVVLGESLEFQEKKVEYTNEGQIKSAMLKGQTLVNLAQTKFGTSGSNINLTKTEIENGMTYTIPNQATGYITIRTFAHKLLKPSTTYTILFEIVENTIQDYNGMTVCGTFDSYFSRAEKQLYHNSAFDLSVGKKRLVVTTSNDISNYDGFGFGFPGFPRSGKEDAGIFTIKNVMVIEGDHSNEDVPYFEGMQSVTVSTRLENLCRLYTNTGENPKTGKTFTVVDAAARAIYLTSAGQYMNIKPNKKYMLQFKISNLVLDGEDSIGISLTDSATNALFKNVDGTNGSTQINSNGIHRLVVVASDIAESSSFVIKGVASEWENSGSTLRSLTISNIMCVEYQNGMENWNLPYFEDYQVMKPVQVESVNKNLLEVPNVSVTTKRGIKIETNEGVFKFTGTSSVSGGRNDLYEDHGHLLTLSFKKGKTYTMSIIDLVENGSAIDGFFITENKTSTALFGCSSSRNLISTYTSLTDMDVHFGMNVLVNETYNSTFKVLIEESDTSTATSYVPYQSKTTYSWDEVILRKVGDVEDTLDLTTGEWIQRIGEKTFTSDNDYQVSIDEATPNITHIRLDADANKYAPNQRNGRNPLTNIIPNNPIYRFSDNTEGIYVDANGVLVLCLSREKATTVDEFKTWLVSNPITVQYVLTTPIVHKVNLSRPNLQVYDDITHVHTKCLDGTLVPNIYLPSDISYPAILEPNKNYNVSINHTQVSADNPLKVNVGGTEITMTDSRMTLTTPTTLANSNVSFTGKGNKIKESMLIKNSSLLTRDLPHFNGIGSVQLGKTIENLCESKVSPIGSSELSSYTEYSDYFEFTISKTGSRVITNKLLKPLENGKKYFVYAPNNYPSTALPQVSFSKTHNGSISFTQEMTQMIDKKYAIVSIQNQEDKLYDKIVVGFHDSIPTGTYTIQKPIICEYEPGMENWDWESIGYFTGTKNIGNEFMRVQNKNFYPYGDSSFTAQQGNTWCWLNGKGCSFGASCIKQNMGNAFYLKKGSYVLNYNHNNSFQTNSIQLVGEYEKIASLNNIKQDGWYAIRVKTTTDNIPVNITNIQLEESSTATTYTAHKHNGLYITKDQPIELTWEQGNVNASTNTSWNDAIQNTVSKRIRTNLMTLKPNTSYRVSLGNKNYMWYLYAFDGNNVCPQPHSFNMKPNGFMQTDFIFTTTQQLYKIALVGRKADDTNITPSEINHVRLEEVTDVVLRSVGYVYDELDITRGVYVQRVGEIVFDGSSDEDWILYKNAESNENTSPNVQAYLIDVSNMKSLWGNFKEIICDKLAIRNEYGDGIESIYWKIKPKCIARVNGAIGISTLQTTVDDFKQELSKNPVKVQYQLATPIIHKVHIGNKNEANTEVVKPNDVFTLPTLYTEQTHIDLTNNGIIPKVQSRDYIAYPVLPMISRIYTLQHNLTGGVSNLTVDLLGRTQSASYQNHKSLVYTPETMDAILHSELRISGKGKISRVMYIDGGYMDREIPYIEGMKNAVNPIVKNVGKNLVQKIDSIWFFYDNTINRGGTKYNCGVAPVKPYTQYIINKNSILCFYDENGKCTNSPFQYFNANSPRTAPSGSKYMLVRHNGEDNATYLDGLQVVEYGQEFDNQEYKENICYVDCGEIKLTPDMFEQGNIVYNSVNAGATYESMKQESHMRIRTKELIKIKPNTKYLLNVKGGYRVFVREFDVSKGKLNDSALSLIDFQSRGVFTTNANAKYISLLIGNLSDTSLPLSDFDKFNLLLIEKDDMIILRSLPHGVHDEIDLETGKYIQRVGEITFNGTENWKVGYASWDNKRTYYNDGFVDIKTTKGDNGSGQAYYDAVRCPQLHRSYMSRLASALIDGVCSYYYSGYQRIFISKQDCATVDELKLWLKENPITVQYELPEPIVKDIVIHNYPHSYEGGHVIIENGDPNTPIPAQLTYRAVTNRSGQIQQHTEQVEKQDKEINELETLILANIHLSQTR